MWAILSWLRLNGVFLAWNLFRRGSLLVIRKREGKKRSKKTIKRYFKFRASFLWVTIRKKRIDKKRAINIFSWFIWVCQGEIINKIVKKMVVKNLWKYFLTKKKKRTTLMTFNKIKIIFIWCVKDLLKLVSTRYNLSVSF